jgi:hypothetical protein
MSLSRIICIFLAALSFSSQLLAAPVAQIVDWAGAVSILRANGKQALADTRSPLDEGDTVVTETNSTAVLAFIDGNKVALRPNTRFQITRYHHVAANPEGDSALFRLVKGGLRTITGLVGKRGNRDAYQLTAATATIGIRGTEFTARVCDGDCGQKGERKPSAAIDPSAAARVVALEGEAKVTRKGAPLILAIGDQLFQGDLIETGKRGFVGIAFSDRTRIVLRHNTRFMINEYRYDGAQPEADSFAVSLLRGALRSVTGLLGQRSAERIRYSTTTATIGIRGTRFDLWCVASGSYGQGGGGSGGAETTECDRGVVTTVREGRVAQANSSGVVELSAGQSGYTDRPGAPNIPLAADAKLPADDYSPLPESLPSMRDNLAASLYVVVNDGTILLGEGAKTVELNRGEGGFAALDGRQPEKIPAPAFLVRDSFLRSVNLNAASCSLP